MGDRNFGCAITNVAIRSGEEVLHVICPASGGVNSIGRMVFRLRDTFGLLAAQDSGGIIARLNAAVSLEILQEDIIWRWGLYDGCGWTYTLDGEAPDTPEDYSLDYDRLLHFMVKKPIAEQVAGDNKEDLLAVMLAVAEFCLFCRINPFSQLGGQQFFDEREYNLHRQRISYIEQALQSAMAAWQS